MCYNEILGCFHGGVGLGENLHTIVVVRRKMVHTSNKHQHNGSNLQDIVVVS